MIVVKVAANTRMLIMTPGLARCLCRVHAAQPCANRAGGVIASTGACANQAGSPEQHSPGCLCDARRPTEWKCGRQRRAILDVALRCSQAYRCEPPSTVGAPLTATTHRLRGACDVLLPRRKQAEWSMQIRRELLVELFEAETAVSRLKRHRLLVERMDRLCPLQRMLLRSMTDQLRQHDCFARGTGDFNFGRRTSRGDPETTGRKSLPIDTIAADSDVHLTADSVRAAAKHLSQRRCCWRLLCCQQIAVWVTTVASQNMMCGFSTPLSSYARWMIWHMRHAAADSSDDAAGPNPTGLTALARTVASRSWVALDCPSHYGRLSETSAST